MNPYGWKSCNKWGDSFEDFFVSGYLALNRMAEWNDLPEATITSPLTKVDPGHSSVPSHRLQPYWRFSPPSVVGFEWPAFPAVLAESCRRFRGKLVSVGRFFNLACVVQMFEMSVGFAWAVQDVDIDKFTE